MMRLESIVMTDTEAADILNSFLTSKKYLAGNIKAALKIAIERLNDDDLVRIPIIDLSNLSTKK